MLVRATRDLLQLTAAGLQHLADGVQHVADGLSETAHEVQLLADLLGQLLEGGAQPALDFLTANQVAELAGVKPATVRSYSARGFMPPPDARFGTVPVWRAETVTTWLERHGKAPADVRTLDDARVGRNRVEKATLPPPRSGA